MKPQEENTQQEKQEKKTYDFEKYIVKSPGFQVTYNSYKDAFKLFSDIQGSAKLLGVKEDGHTKLLKSK